MANRTTPAARPAHTATTDAGTFRAFVTGSDFGSDDETGEPWTLFTMVMEAPDGSTIGYFSKPGNVRSDFSARVW